MWGLGGLPLRPRTLLLSIPPFLLALHLLLLIIVGSGLPGAAHVRGRARDRDGAVAFAVLSIEPERSAQRRGAPVQRAVREEEEAGRVYVDENETHERQTGPRELEVQLWAADTPSFAAEVNRFVAYISTPQLNCSRVLSPEQTLAASSRWLLCADDWLLPAADRLCVAYSFSMDGGDKEFLETVSRLGCEIHCFDPSSSDASGGCPGNSLASNCGDRGRVSKHKMWLEWRAQKRRGRKARGDLGRVSRTLANIMAALGHHTVHFLYADLLSAEWRVFQSWIEAGTLQHVRHLVATVHLHWAGFEVGGSDEEVLRYWYSVLWGLQASGLKLVHSSAGESHIVLRQAVTNAHSSYTLSWVNMRH
ncbi:methyltransferase-like protein 24 [Oryzias melastigma]|uniref:Methyltransferase-like protein 24 n=1 Tax=Oryzias melastigma TaxID=30732 RepID=A0A3B3DAJ0_ORYME|nr:methyltransferase-like protein 24 [Oryzias melastigma]